jgi:transcriptional regulator with XRE-family HTH domain
MVVARTNVPNVRLREFRQRRDLTLEALAEALARLADEALGEKVGVNAEMIGKWERGAKRPSPLYRKLLVMLYGVSEEQLGFRSPAPDDDLDDELADADSPEVTRRDFLRGAATMGAGALAMPSQVPRRVDTGAVIALRGLIPQYARMDNLLGPSHVLSLVAVHLNYIGELLGVASGGVRDELLGVGASYAEFAGWLHQDAGDTQSAAYWSDRALAWAEAGSDRRMISYVLMRKSNQASTLGDANRALTLARGSLRHPEQLSPRGRALALRQEARAHALSGNETAAARSIDAAREAVAAADVQDPADLALTGYCTPSYIEGEAADCWLLLQRPRKAAAIFEESLASWPAGYERDRGLNLARLAVAHAASQEPERACEVARQAVTITHDTWSARAVGELRRLPTLLEPWGASAPVAELEESLAALP